MASVERLNEPEAQPLLTEVLGIAQALAAADEARQLVQALQKQGARPSPRAQSDRATAPAAAILAPSAPTTLLEQGGREACVVLQTGLRSRAHAMAAPLS